MSSSTTPPTDRPATTTPSTTRPSEERLVLAANRIFHDLEGAHYEEKHDEIFVAERARWQRIAGSWLAGSAERQQVLDIGTGTGFVPSVVAPFLQVGDSITCTDLSETMLGVAKRRLESLEFVGDFSFQAIDGESYPFPSKSFTAITGNSVIHHIPDLARLFGELDRVLKPGGIILLGHEPNARHYALPGLRRRVALYSRLFDPLSTMIGLGKRLGFAALARRLGVHSRLRGAALAARGGGLAEQVSTSEALLDQVAETFVTEGILPEAPSRAQIVEWVDFHSPTAGEEVDPSRGIDVEEIRSRWLPDYECLHFESYDHLYGGGHAIRRRAGTDRIDRALARRYPEGGATLFAVLRKPSPEPAEGADTPR